MNTPARRPRATLRALLASLAAAAALGACTIMSNFPTGGGTPPAPPPAGGCNALPIGDAIQPEQTTAEAPAPTGGHVVDGTYRLGGFLLHVRAPADAAPPRRALTVRVAGDVMQLVSVRGDDRVERASFRFAVDGTVMLLDRTCGDWAPAVRGYDATATQLRVYVELPDGVGVWLLERIAP